MIIHNDIVHFQISCNLTLDIIKFFVKITYYTKITLTLNVFVQTICKS